MSCFIEQNNLVKTTISTRIFDIFTTKYFSSLKDSEIHLPNIVEELQQFCTWLFHIVQQQKLWPELCHSLVAKNWSTLP